MDEMLIGFYFEVLIERGKIRAPVVVEFVLIKEVEMGVEYGDHGLMGALGVYFLT